MLNLHKQCAERMAGSTWEAQLIVNEAGYRARWKRDIPLAAAALRKIECPAEPTPDEQRPGQDRFVMTRSTYYRAQITLAWCEVLLGQSQNATDRLNAFPNRVRDPEAEFAQELSEVKRALANAAAAH